VSEGLIGGRFRVRDRIGSGDHPGAWFGLGRAHDRSGRADDALRAYRRYLALDADGHFAHLARDRVETLRREPAQ